MSDKKHQETTFSTKDQQEPSSSESASSSSTTTTTHSSSSGSDSKSGQTPLLFNSIFTTNKNRPGQILTKQLPMESLLKLSETNHANQNLFGETVRRHFFKTHLGPNIELLLDKSPDKKLGSAASWHLKKLQEIKASYPVLKLDKPAKPGVYYDSEEEDFNFLTGMLNMPGIYPDTDGDGFDLPTGMLTTGMLMGPYHDSDENGFSRLPIGMPSDGPSHVGDDDDFNNPIMPSTEPEGLAEFHAAEAKTKPLSERSFQQNWLLDTIYAYPEYHLHALISDEQLNLIITNFHDLLRFFVPYKEGSDPQPIGHRIMEWFLNSNLAFRIIDSETHLHMFTLFFPKYADKAITRILGDPKLFNHVITDSENLKWFKNHFPQYQELADKMFEAVRKDQKTMTNNTTLSSEAEPEPEPEATITQGFSI